jgi:hypothetical protein
MFNRTRVVNELMDNDYDTIMNSDYGPELLREYLASGFVGYNNMTDEQLVEEMNIRDISYLYDELTTED